MRKITPFTTKTNLTVFSQNHHETKIMQNRRLAGLAAYPQLPLPKFPKIHYQNWPLIPQTQSTAYSRQISTSSARLQTDTKTMIQQVGANQPQINLSTEAQQKGVVALDIFQAQQRFPQLFADHYMTKALPADAHRLAAYHVAAMNSGIFIYVPPKVQLQEPLTLTFWQNARKKIPYVHHVLIIGGRDSQFSLMETRETLGDQAISANIVEEVILEPGAQLRFNAIDQLQQPAYLARHAYLQTQARIDWALGAMNDSQMLADFNTDLVGDGSHAEVKAVAISTGQQIQGLTNRVTNYGLHTEGNILQHGVILADATLIFNGIGHIVKGARDSDAQQENRILMLSKTARGDANPILLIDENDVRAGHAASVGRVNAEQMYYLMSRGLAKDLAERLVIRGFLGSVLAEIPVKSVQDALKATIERKLIDGQRHRARTQ